MNVSSIDLENSKELDQSKPTVSEAAWAIKICRNWIAMALVRVELRLKVWVTE